MSKKKSVRSIIYNPKNKQYYSLRLKSSTKGRKGTIMGVWNPERIHILGKTVSNRVVLLALMIGAIAVCVVSLLPIIIGYVIYPFAVVNLLTGFGAGMIFILLPFLVLEVRDEVQGSLTSNY